MARSPHFVPIEGSRGWYPRALRKLAPTRAYEHTGIQTYGPACYNHAMHTALWVITLIFYVMTFALQYARVKHGCPCPRLWVLIFALVAILMHAQLLHILIDVPGGENLSFWNMFSLSAWLVMLLLFLITLVRPLEVIFLVMVPVVAVSMVISVIFYQPYLSLNTAAPENLFHILLSVLTFAMLCVAGLQALALLVQDRMLKNKYEGIWTKYLPPLQSLEKTLFQTILLGFILLTIEIVSSIYLFYPLLWTNPAILQKTILSLIIWLIFFVLLLGHYAWGWRGRRAIYLTLGGVWLLVLVYFGSRLVLGG